MQNLLKNGSFVQRRKMYAILPFHNLASKIPIDWQSKDIPTLERQRIKEKQIYEQEYIKRTYNDKIEQKLKQKFSLSQQENEALINQTLDKKNADRDTLAQQLDNFNQSKLIQNNGGRNNPQIQIHHKNQINHKQPQIIPPSPYVNRKVQQNQEQQYLSRSQPHTYSPQTYNDVNLQYQGGVNSRQRYEGPIKDAYNIKPPQERNINYRNQERYREQSTPKSYYGYDLKDQYRRYAEFLPPDQPFRNVMPDKLQNFLREKTKADRKRTISVNLSMAK